MGYVRFKHCSGLRCRPSIIAFIALVILLTPFGSGAGGTSWDQIGEASSPPSPTPGFPRTVVDGTGREVVVQAPPQRIFSAAAAIDHILLNLVERERIAAITRYLDPRYTGGRHEGLFQVDQLSPEYVVALQPDLILVTSWNDPEAVDQIRLLSKSPIYTFTGFDSIETTLQHIMAVGELTGTEKKATALVGEFCQRLEAITWSISDASRPRVLTYTPWGWTAGAATVNDSVINYAGGRNVAAEAGLLDWLELSIEAIIEMNPDVILASPGEDDREDLFAQTLMADPALQDVRAIRTGRVYAVDHLSSLDHHLILAVEQLAAKLHPDRLHPESRKQLTRTESHSTLSRSRSQSELAIERVSGNPTPSGTRPTLPSACEE